MMKYIIDGVVYSKAQFEKKERELSDTRQLVFIGEYRDNAGTAYEEYEEMTDGQYADHMAGLRE